MPKKKLPAGAGPDDERDDAIGGVVVDDPPPAHDDDDDVEEAPPPALVFNTSSREQPSRTAGDDEAVIHIDKVAYTMLRPTDEDLALLSTVAARRTRPPDQMLEIARFIDRVFTDESAMRLQARFEDRNDAFGLEALVDLMQDIVNYWLPERRSRQRGGGQRRPRRR